MRGVRRKLLVLKLEAAEAAFIHELTYGRFGVGHEMLQTVMRISPEPR